MEQFEKYKLKCCKTCATDVYIDMCEVCPAIRQRRIGWRAALEMILEKSRELEYGDSIGQVIEQELQ